MGNRNYVGEGFKSVTEEAFLACFEGLRGCVPNESNSDYEERKINFFINIDTDEADASLVVPAMVDDVYRLDRDDLIQDVATDVDDADVENQLVFFDLYLKPETTASQLRALLLALEQNIA